MYFRDPINLYLDVNDGTVDLFGYYDALIINIFLFAGMCVSLSALIWTFHVFYTLCKHGGRISAFIILLIINDLAELLLSAIIASYLTDSYIKIWVTKHLKDLIQVIDATNYLINNKLVILIHLFTACRNAGHYLHQLVALESIITIRSQICSAQVFTPLCSTITCIILWLVAIGFRFLYSSLWLNLMFNFLPCCILAIKCVLTCKASPVPDRINPGLAVMLVSTLTLIASCATSVLEFVFEKYFYYFDLSAFLVSIISLRVISDPLLCILVSKEQLSVRKQQTHTEINADQRSV